MRCFKITLLSLRNAISCSGFALLIAGGAAAQPAWRPEKPVEFVVPTVAGGNNDIIMRTAQRILQDRKLVPVPIVVANRPGGNQYVAALHVHQRPGDPHYVLLANPAHFTNELSGLSAHGYRELTPLVMLLIENTVLTVRAGSSFKSMRDLVEKLRGDPDSVSFAMPSRGGQPHLMLAAALKVAGLDPRRLKVVVYKGSGESIPALLGGHVDVMVSSAGSVLSVMQSGQARILAIGAAQRMTGSLAAAPTFREQGIDSIGVAAWRGLFGARALAPAHLAYWEDNFSKMNDTPEWRKHLEDGDVTPQFLRSREFTRYLESEYAATRAAMHDIGMLK